MTRSPHPCNHIRHLLQGIAGIVATFLLGACGASQPVRVLPAGTTIITASVGGPIVPETSPIGFAPSVLLGAAHGIADDLTIHGNVHALMAVFGVAGLDLGASYRLLPQQGAMPELTASARAIMFLDCTPIGDPRLYPDASVTASWDVHGGLLAYAGSHGTLQTSDGTFLLSPFLGVQIPIATQWDLQVEGMWQAANVRTEHGIFEGRSGIGSTGSIGMFLGVQVRP